MFRYPLPMTKPNIPCSQITVPTRALPVVRALYARMRDVGMTYDQLQAKSGVKRSTSKAWRRHNSVTPGNLQATLRAVGLLAIPVPCAAVLPPDILAELHAIGERHGVPLPIAEFVMVAASREVVPC